MECWYARNSCEHDDPIKRSKEKMLKKIMWLLEKGNEKIFHICTKI
jgi:hypothetical protein